MNEVDDTSNITFSTNRSSIQCVKKYDPYEDSEKWLLGVVALPFIIIGLMANAMSILIFSHRHMRQQRVNWYLLVLAFSDSVILISGFFVLSLPRLGELSQFWTLTSIGYHSTPYFYAIMVSAQTVSVWMTTAMSIHRFVGVCLPFKASRILETRNVKALIGGVIILSILFNTSRLFEVEVAAVCKMFPINVELPDLRATDLRTNPIYIKFFYGWAYAFVMFVIPFSILIAVNFMVILAIHRSRQVHSKLNFDDGSRKQELAKEISTSIMLVGVVLAFLLCNTLAFVANLLEKLEFYELYVVIVPWSNMLVMTNASINICIYCMFSDKYRQLFSYYVQFLNCSKKPGTNFHVVSIINEGYFGLANIIKIERIDH